ncbi:concanavalin A-like lectin/glucanase domain-containing protein [Mycena galopus ATCC 62051]|nr:concanavalin A-like lectin/glucanase domain-containing protein [Mycena galopus ATCC 62051]
MGFIGSLFLLLAVVAAEVSQTLNTTGTDAGGFYYSLYATNGTDVTFSESGQPGVGGGFNTQVGTYSIQWSDSAGYLLGGNGWAPGSSENFQFWTDFSGDGGNSSLSFYGWTTDPLVEYHIVEDLSASQADRFAGLVVAGTVSSDGSLYNIYETQRVEEPSILGLATFRQYWSVRQSPRNSGILTTENHFDAWVALGMPLGDLNYQILAVESVSGSGSVEATVMPVGFIAPYYLFSLTPVEPSAKWHTDYAVDKSGNLALSAALARTLAFRKIPIIPTVFRSKWSVLWESRF